MGIFLTESSTNLVYHLRINKINTRLNRVVIGNLLITSI
jgi:hypothetical protein